MKIKTLIIVLLCIGACVLLLNSCSGDKKKAIRTGDTLSQFSGIDLEGKTFSLSSHKGSPVIVRFFLLNCPYCKADTPIFNKFYDKYQKKGLEIVYINNNGTNSEEVQNFADDLDIRFPVIFDPEGKISKQYNIKVQPLALVLSPEHKLLAALLGGVSEAELNELLDQYFQG
ncbi:peroxiredoxin family protein [Thermodesulfobacteriota bacterium]